MDMQLTLLCLLASIFTAADSQLSPKCTKETCKLPECFCAGRRGPSQLSIQETPKIVMFTFDDAVNDQNMKFYKRLFTKRRKNPNGCRMVATFFISHDWTDYDMVRELYLDGHEMASHSITHRLPRTWWAKADYYDWQEELAGQRDNIAKEAGVPYSMIRGVRVPFLEIGADNQFEMMRDEEFEYDASFLSGPYSGTDWRQPVWPYTLDYAPNLEFCDSKNCPTGNFSGIWEIPMNRWIGLDSRACPMVDACTTQNLNVKGDAYKYLMSNFDRHFKGNRAPLAVNIHATWFEKEHHFEAMNDFVETLSKRGDVWVITMHEMVEWMRNPTPADELKNFDPWMNSCKKGRMLIGTKGKKPKKHNSKERKKIRKVKEEKVVEEEENYDETEQASKEVTEKPRHRKRNRRPRPTKSAETSDKKITTESEEYYDEEKDVEEETEVKKESKPTRARIQPTQTYRNGIETHPHRINPNYNSYPGNPNANFRYRSFSSAATSFHSPGFLLSLTLIVLVTVFN